MGDVNKAVEKKLLDTGRLPNKIDTLIVGHHGWHDSSSEALLKHLKPTQAIISINANNARGYPHVTTIQRLHRHSGSIKRTDVSGDIFIVGLDTK